MREAVHSVNFLTEASSTCGGRQEYMSHAKKKGPRPPLGTGATKNTVSTYTPPPPQPQVQRGRCHPAAVAATAMLQR
jgi:hypothetical protein